MNKPLFKKWKPIADLPRNLFLKGLYDDHEGFRILLETESDNSILKLSFNEVLSYQSADEGDLTRIFDESDGIERWHLYTVSNSTFLENFHYNSYGIHRDKAITHFAIYTPNGCLDILSSSEPQVGWIVT